MPAPRPTKYTPECVARIVDALREGNTRRTACALGCISDETFSNWCKQHLEFLDSIKKAESEAEAEHVANVKRAATGGTWQASAWWLERKRPDDWGRVTPFDPTALEKPGT